MICLFLVLLLWIATTDADTLFLALSQSLCVFLLRNGSGSLSNHNYNVNVYISYFMWLCTWLSDHFYVWFWVHFCISPILWVLCVVVCVCRCQSLPPAGGLYLIQMNSLLFFERVRLATNKSSCFLSFNWNSFRRVGITRICWLSESAVDNLSQIRLVLLKIQA